MYKVNDTVLYGNEGICQIENIIEKKLTNQSIEYYVLKPVYKDNATVYVPTQNQDLVKKMKKLLSYDEIMDLIQNMPDCPVDWIENDNQRKENIVKLSEVEIINNSFKWLRRCIIIKRV